MSSFSNQLSWISPYKWDGVAADIINPNNTTERNLLQRIFVIFSVNYIQLLMYLCASTATLHPHGAAGTLIKQRCHNWGPIFIFPLKWAEKFPSESILEMSVNTDIFQRASFTFLLFLDTFLLAEKNKSKTKNRTCKCWHQRKLMNNFRRLNAVVSSSAEVEWKYGIVFDAAQRDGFLTLSSRDTNDMFK